MRTQLSRKLKFLIALVVFGVAVWNCSAQPDSDSTFVTARRHMIQTQLVTRDITDKRVLKAFEKVERHKFVSEELWQYAYIDHPLPIGEEQTISQPYIVALMTQLLHLSKDDRVLEIGTGSGYQAAILAELAGEIYTIEIIDTLGRRAGSLLEELGYDNVSVRIGDGYQGWPEQAPFDAIIVTCAPAEIPQPLIDQLSEGGRMIVPVGEDRQELILVQKKEGKLSEEKVIPVRFVPMTGKSTENK